MFLGTTPQATVLQEAKGLYDDTQLQFDSINEIFLVRDKQQFVFKKHDFGWEQTEPFSMSMDPASMQAIIHE